MVGTELANVREYDPSIMADSYDLAKLGPVSFEHMVNALALRVLGAGQTGFCPGADGGRDGYFQGYANYPSGADPKSRWNGVWYLQSKFHAPHLSKDPQRWLLEQIGREIELFKDPTSGRHWPDNWIIATNIDPSGVAKTGTFDRARQMVFDANKKLSDRFAIWGGRKLLDLLIEHSDVARHYGHFLTPGEVLSEMSNALQDCRASVERLIWHLVVGQMQEYQFSKLEQAGAAADDEPGIHALFIDLPIQTYSRGFEHPASKSNDGYAIDLLLQTSAASHRASAQRYAAGSDWVRWRRDARRAGVWFVRGGPGQGKSTIGQYFAQLQRARIVQLDSSLNTSPKHRELAAAVENAAKAASLWPETPRIPLTIELKDFAQWFASQQMDSSGPHRILKYVAGKLSASVGQTVETGTLRRAMALRSWFVLFDGLDEVPHDVKSLVAAEVLYFIENEIVEMDADVLICCTSRPQGYSGEFSRLECAGIVLPLLDADQALGCAKPLVSFKRSESDAGRDMEILTKAMQSDSIRQLMTTPLQSHIMAIVVREGGKPPDRRWQLFRNFYDVIRKREANHHLPDAELTALLRDKTQLLKLVHGRLGFVLHARAETSEGAQTFMEKSEFEKLVHSAVADVGNEDQRIVRTVMEATTERLVLVNTPDSGDHVRFDVRQLQEFFAGEFIYEDLEEGDLRSRFDLLEGDSHWREVLHFLLSAIVETRRQMELPVAAQALEGFDEDEDLSIGMLNRRLCRGSLAVLRLLGEGVLEQDRRMRQPFRHALLPAFESTEDAVLSQMLSIGFPASRNWLLDLMIANLEKSRPEEHIGAAVGVATLLHDDHEAVPRVMAAFSEAPHAFLGLVGRIAARIRGTRRPPEWFVGLLCDLVASEHWPALHTATRDGIRLALAWSCDTAMEVASNRGWSPMEVDLLGWYLQPEDELQVGATESVKIVRLTYYEPDWARGLPGASIGAYAEEPSPSSPFGRLLHAIVRFGTLHTPVALRELASVAAGYSPSLLSSLPGHVKAQIPIGFSDGIADHLSEMRGASDRDLLQLLQYETFRGQRVPRPSVVTLAGLVPSDGEWASFVNGQPGVALTLISEAVWRRSGIGRPLFVDDLPARPLVDALLARPEALLFAPGQWGRLIRLRPKSEKKLREAILHVADGAVTRLSRDTEFFPFAIRLPAEAAMLPHIAGPVAFTDRPELAFAIPHVSRLHYIAADSSYPNRVRLAAHLLSWFHPDGGIPPDDAQFLGLLTSESLPWVLPVFDKFVRRMGPAQATVCRFTGNVLRRMRSEFGVREALDPLLGAWREMSRGPMTRANVVDAWLKLLDSAV